MTKGDGHGGKHLIRKFRNTASDGKSYKTNFWHGSARPGSVPFFALGKGV